MDRVKSSRFKIYMVVLTFFLLLVGAFIGMLLWLERDVNQMESGQQVVYFLTDSDYEDILQKDGAMVFRTEQAIQSSRYREEAFAEVRSKFLPLSFAFVLFLFVASMLLACLWRWLWELDMRKLAHQLNMMTEREVHAENAALDVACRTLRQTLEDHLNDYKRLSSYLSHEQKNTLAVLRTELELSGQTQSLQRIDDMTDTINDILTLSETPELADAPGVVDAALVCAKVCDDYRKISDQITFEFNEEDETGVEARQRWIYRAVANLLDNAIKYGKGNPICVSVYAKKGSVIVRVEDHGIGISAEKQEKIFQHRYRVEELNKDGYGIGLSLVSHVCNLCGGFVAVESKVGEGSVFYLSFPQKKLFS